MWAATEVVPRIHSDGGLQPISVALKASWRLLYKAPSIQAKRGSRRPTSPHLPAAMDGSACGLLTKPALLGLGLIPSPPRLGTIDSLELSPQELLRDIGTTHKPEMALSQLKSNSDSLKAKQNKSIFIIGATTPLAAVKPRLLLIHFAHFIHLLSNLLHCPAAQVVFHIFKMRKLRLWEGEPRI